MSAKLKQQITDLLLGNNDILKLIAEAVSSLIVDKFTNSEENHWPNCGEYQQETRFHKSG